MASLSRQTPASSSLSTPTSTTDVKNLTLKKKKKRTPRPRSASGRPSAPRTCTSRCSTSSPPSSSTRTARACSTSGQGSGYLVACLYKIVGERGGEVVGIEKHAPLAQRSLESLRKVIPEALESGKVRVGAGNVLAEGALERDDELFVGALPAAPGISLPRDNDRRKFDAIHVGAAAARLPQALVDALKPGGRMVIPLGPEGGNQVLSVIDKNPVGGGGFTKKDLLGVRFVPLTEPGKDRHGGL